MFDDTKLETWIVDSELWRRWRRSWGWGRGHLGYFHISIIFFFAVATVQPTLSTSLFFRFPALLASIRTLHHRISRSTFKKKKRIEKKFKLCSFCFTAAAP
jgi:hypothetical protein